MTTQKFIDTLDRLGYDRDRLQRLYSDVGAPMAGAFLSFRLSRLGQPMDPDFIDAEVVRILRGAK